MKKYKWTFLVLFIISLFIGFAAYKYYIRSNLNKDNNYDASKTSVEDKSNNTNEDANKQNIPPKTVEETISTYNTKIYSKDSARQNNIHITCNTLNNYIVAPGETFSFCTVVGEATSSKGYQKADIYDKNGNKKKGLGGGNCQISSTLYNAVLNIPDLAVIERHPHSNKVPYVETGKDAAVAFGSYDFKFKNNLSYSIKISATTDDSFVYISLIQIKTI